MAPRSLPALLLLGLLAGGFTLGGRQDVTSGTATGATADGYAQVVRPVLAEHGCTPVGFDDVEDVRAALVRTPRGRLVLVSAARGREVYDGRRPGVLVAVCTRRP
ncbi:hypothetical protein [Nocardioides sp. W7]|uniref:hypothetical protein n=1 Tax=Nocardioides sp. W7 TaxID=2931390 RepID=UPI001FCF9B75|nr:hypothetical protein [Nocardioides sp. W7]